MKPIRVALAEDHPLYREGLRCALGAYPGRVELVGEARDGAEAVVVVAQVRPDVMLMDVRMAGMNGVEATRQIKAEWPAVHVIALSAFDDEVYVLEMVKAGAEGYLLKDADISTIMDGIEAVVRGETPIHPSVASKLIRQLAELAQASPRHADHPYDGLTERELEVLRLIARGATNREVAQQLVISERTVDNHVRSIYQKLGIDDRPHAVLYAVRKGLVQLDEAPSGR